MRIHSEKEVQGVLSALLDLVRENCGVSQRLAEFLWAAHCGSGSLDFSLFSSLDQRNLNRVKMILNYRLHPAAGGYNLPLSADEEEFLYRLTVA